MAVAAAVAVTVVAIVYALIAMVSVSAGATVAVEDIMAVAAPVAVVANVSALITMFSVATGAPLAVGAAVAESIRSKHFVSKTRNLIFGTNVRKKAAYKIDPWSQSSGLKNLTITW